MWDSLILRQSNREKNNPKENRVCLRRVIHYGLFLSCILPSYAGSLGLGDITVKSSLNAPLQAEIELLAARPEELEKTRIQLASPQEFDKVGIVRSQILDQLNFELPIIIGKKAYTPVTTNLPIREPYLNFLVEVQWPRGRLLREYTIHLKSPSPTTESVQSETELQASSDEQLPISRAEQTVKPVENSNQTHSSSTVTKSHPPSTAQLNHKKHTQSQKRRIYKSVSGDTLILIVRKLFPDTKFELYQLMIAIVKANPSAFIESNVNGLKAGVELKLPTPDEINQITPAQALAEVNLQNNQWLSRTARAGVFNTPRQTTAYNSPPQPTDNLVAPLAEREDTLDTQSELKKTSGEDHQEAQEETIEKATNAAKKIDSDRNSKVLHSVQSTGRLTISATDTIGEHQNADNPTTSDYIASLEKSTTLAQELAESRQQQILEMKNRLKILEPMMTQQERLIALQNDQLAELEERVKDAEYARHISEQKKWWLFLSGLLIPTLPLLYVLYRFYLQPTGYKSIAIGVID